jgi:hypothetical protein
VRGTMTVSMGESAGGVENGSEGIVESMEEC